MVLQGVGTSPTTNENRAADFASDNSYAISFYRQGYMTSIPTAHILDDVYARVAPKNDGYHWTVASPIVRADQYDWVNKLSYTDKTVISDKLPPIYPDKTYDYHGFLTTGLEIKKDIYKYFKDDDVIKLTLASKGYENANLDSPKVVEIPVSELKALYGDATNWKINFNYDNNIKEDEDDLDQIVFPDPDSTLQPTIVMGKIVSNFDKTVS